MAQDSIKDREVVISRVIFASRERVWNAWTDPNQVPLWWGPNGFRNTFHKFDMRVGGTWEFIMHGPDGTDYPNRLIFREIKEYERLVFAHDSNIDNDPNGFHTEVTFEDQGDMTKVTMTSVFKSAEARNLVVEKFGAIEGGNQTLGRLEAHLGKQ